MAKSHNKAMKEIIGDVEGDLKVNGGSGGAAAVDDLPHDIVRGIEEDVEKLVLKGDLDEAAAGKEVAKRISEKKLEFQGVRKNAETEAALKITRQMTPSLRTIESGSAVTRGASQKLSEQVLELEKNTADIATPISVQRAVLSHQAKLYQGLKGMDDLYVQYAKGHAKGFGDVVTATAKANIQKRFGVQDAKMTYKEFRVRVGAAMREGDVSDIPEVAQAAQLMRREVYEPMRKLAAEHIDEEYANLDPVTAVSYLNRKYDLEMMERDREGFIGITAQWLMGRQQENIARADKFEADLPKMKEAIQAKRQEIQALEETTFEATAKTIREETNVVLDDILEEIGDKIDIPPGTTAPDAKQAERAARKAFLKTLKKELGEAVEKEVEIASQRAATDVADDIIAKADETPDDELLEVIRGELPPPPAEAGRGAAVKAIEDNLARAKTKAVAKANSAFSRSLKAQQTRLLKELTDAKSASSAAKSKIKSQIALEARNAAKSAAREASAELRKELNKAVKELQQKKKLHQRDVAERALTEDDYRSLAGEIHARIMSTPDGRSAYDMAITKDPTKGKGVGKTGRTGELQGRKFLIPDKLISKYLESDVEQLSKVYIRNMSADIELARAFPDDNLDLEKTIKSIEEDWAAKAETDPDWKKKSNADIRDIAAMRDKIRGTYGMPQDPMSWGNRVGRAMRQLNYIRLLGGMTLSAIPDLARPVMVHGFGRVFKDAIIPMMREFKKFAKASKEVRDMGLAMDMLTNSRMQSIADVTDDFARHSRFERTLGAMSDTMGMISLMSPWNTAMKQIAGAVSQARIMRAIVDDVAGKISQTEMQYLRASGIGAEQSKLIAAQLKQFGEVSENGLQLPRWDTWEDPEAKRFFQAAVGRDVDRIIVTPSGTDVPLWAGANEFTRMMFQFKSFAFASTQRTMLAGLQQRDMAALNGLWLSIAMGSLTAGIKMVDSNRTDEMKDWSMDKWLVEGVDRSGVTGWLFEANNMIEKATRGHVGVSALTGEAPMSRYASRNVAGALLGPSLGLTTSAFGITGAVSEAAFGEDDWYESDTHAIRRILPYQNLMGLRRLLDIAEDGINSSLGVRR